MSPLADNGKIDLHLFARRRLKPHNRLSGLLLQRQYECRKHTVTSLADLLQQHAGVDPMGLRGLNPFKNVWLEWIEFAGTRSPIGVMGR